MMSDSVGICWSSSLGQVKPGQYFTPVGKDVCEKCKCFAGKAVGCYFEKCLQPPDCAKFKPIEGTCCEVECLQDGGLSSDKTELAMLLSLSTGLALLLIILILVLYCRRQGLKKPKEEQSQSTSTTTTTTKTQTATEQSNTTSLPAVTASTQAQSQEEPCVELPPPYTPHTRKPPNEPPPPYADKVESAV